MSTLIVSFYTEKYAEEAERLMHSCREWDLEAHIENVADHGSWERNCAYKPFFILEKMQQFQRPLFWIDADAIFVQKPDFTIFESSDFSCRILDFLPEDHSSRVLSGSLFVNNTPDSREILKRWCQECSCQLADKTHTGDFWDQTALRDVLSALPIAKFLPMPASYAKIAYIDQFFSPTESVIEHFQASRRLKV